MELDCKLEILADMAKFYETQRKRIKILIEKDGTPSGAKWSLPDPPSNPAAARSRATRSG